ncbi:hypothetical protein H5410_014652 [Solanum commersonii]|uniref:Uncharacterized protein n=1 Tax=Solanum commersonii TaxID=4109 RepID=A0A9J5ZS17_SOLCO|nr:hypothetical protein H5410_014652 [Solanum commersonii]
MSTHSLGYQSSDFGFATSLSRESQKHMGDKSNGYKKLNLDLSKGRRIEKTHIQLGEDKLLSSSLPKTLSKLERKMQKLIFSLKITIMFGSHKLVKS